MTTLDSAAATAMPAYDRDQINADLFRLEQMLDIASGILAGMTATDDQRQDRDRTEALVDVGLAMVKMMQQRIGPSAALS